MTARPKLAIVDTGSGNLRSVQKALEAVGADAQITHDPETVASADKIVVPGQGAFGGCVAGLERDGGALRESVLTAIKRGQSYLGICLGLQILFETSEEDLNCRGLGLVPGKVLKFAVASPLKIPHMGWNACTRRAAAERAGGLEGTPDGTYFYFVHSYYAAPSDARDVALESTHGVRFCAAVARENIFACQFHPEKSQQAGLKLLAQFVSV